MNGAKRQRWMFHWLRPYLLKQLKRVEVEPSSLYKFYTACIRSVFEYACQVFHSSLRNLLSCEVENVQKRALRIIHSEMTYNEALGQAKLEMTYVLNFSNN